MIAVIDTGGANLASVMNALGRLRTESVLTTDPEIILTAPRVLLPGVGAAADSMTRIKNAGLIETIRKIKAPVLGICLGMQILFESSSEGNAECLGIIPGRVEKIQPAPGLTIPHMGWNRTYPTRACKLFDGIPEGAYFYYVHSFHAPKGDSVCAETTHGSQIPVAVQKDNFYGVQFHPEKSSRWGQKILENFLSL